MKQAHTSKATIVCETAQVKSIGKEVDVIRGTWQPDDVPVDLRIVSIRARLTALPPPMQIPLCEMPNKEEFCMGRGRVSMSCNLQLRVFKKREKKSLVENGNPHERTLIEVL